MRYVGIDPGHAGALVVLGSDGRTVLGATSWARCRRPPVLDDLLRDATAIAVEGVHVGVGRRSSLTLAEWRGRLLAALPDVPLSEPQPSAWRGAVFGRGNLRRDDAKRAAMAAAAKYAIDWPHDLRITEHTAEAWCIARYCWGVYRVR